jgi:hypothetical protein
MKKFLLKISVYMALIVFILCLAVDLDQSTISLPLYLGIFLSSGVWVALFARKAIGD